MFAKQNSNLFIICLNIFLLLSALSLSYLIIDSIEVFFNSLAFLSFLSSQVQFLVFLRSEDKVSSCPFFEQPFHFFSAHLYS